MGLFTALLGRKAPTFVSVVHKAVTEIVGVDDENQDERSDAPDDGNKVQQKANGGQQKLLGRVPQGNDDGPQDVLECLLQVEREFLAGEDCFGLFGKERVNRRHQDVDDCSADENEECKGNDGEDNLDADHRRVNPAVHVLDTAFDNAVNPVTNADARKYKRHNDNDVQKNGDEQISSEIVRPNQAERFEVRGKTQFKLM